MTRTIISPSDLSQRTREILDRVEEGLLGGLAAMAASMPRVRAEDIPGVAASMAAISRENLVPRNVLSASGFFSRSS